MYERIFKCARFVCVFNFIGGGAGQIRILKCFFVIIFSALLNYIYTALFLACLPVHFNSVSEFHVFMLLTKYKKYMYIFTESCISAVFPLRTVVNHLKSIYFGLVNRMERGFLTFRF